MIFAVLAATDTHWLVLQSVAWTSMLFSNLRTDTVEQAVAQTFDGKHPCCLCKAIHKGKQSEKKSDARLESKMADYSYTNFEFAFCPPSEFYETGAAVDEIASLTRAPSVPPPKSLLA